MPKGNRTGPENQGPRTGRAAGYCAGFPTPGYLHPGMGRVSRANRGPFRGRGMRHRHWYHAGCHPGWISHDVGFPEWETMGMPYYPPDLEPDEEKEVLKENADLLKQHLEDIQKRMAELKKDKKA